MIIHNTSNDFQYEPFNFLVKASLDQFQLEKLNCSKCNKSSCIEKSTNLISTQKKKLKPNEKNEKIININVCHNRECNNPKGYPSKPNSIYCSSKCQSREQNLRQGRVKNVNKIPNPITPTIRKSSRKSLLKGKSNTIIDKK